MVQKFALYRPREAQVPNQPTKLSVGVGEYLSPSHVNARTVPV